MSRCAVCSLEGATAVTVASGKLIGHAHDGECSILLWEAYVLPLWGAGPWERAEHQWRWRRHDAHVKRRPFTEPPPKSPGEIESGKEVARLGHGDVTREVS
jgi:hypothetical protein